MYFCVVTKRVPLLGCLEIGVKLVLAFSFPLLILCSRQFVFSSCLATPRPDILPLTIAGNNCMTMTAQDSQKQMDGEGSRRSALHEANIFHSAFYPSATPSSSSAANDDGIRHSSSSFENNNKPKNERICLGGHRETIFGLSFSPDGIYFATASQDSTIGIWSVKSHRLVTTLKEGMDVKFECLRVAWSMGRGSKLLNGGNNEKYILASAGADGIARLWSACVPNSAAVKTEDDTHNINGINDGAREEPLKWQCVGMLDHYMFEKKERNGYHSQKDDDDDDDDDEKEEVDDNDRPQIYALQFLQSKKMKARSSTINTECYTNNENTNYIRLLTSTNDCIYLWDIIALDECSGSDKMPQSCGRTNLRKFHLQTMIRFAHVNDNTRYNINTFGGERNPDNALFVFDASHCETNDWLGVALSDGTCRVLCNDSGDDGDKGESSSSYQERCVLGLPPDYFGNSRGGGHLTALSWDASGTRLATCFASGRVVLWSIHAVKKGTDAIDVLLQPSCMSVLEGGMFA